MKKILCLFAGLLALPFLPLASALPLGSAESSFPAKKPVLNYVTPKNWKAEVDPKDGSVSIHPENGRIAVTFGELDGEATMDVFEKVADAMVKGFKDPVVTEKPKIQSEDGLTGYTATYAAKLEDKPALVIIMLFKAGKERSILGNIIVTDPETLSKEDGESLASLAKSIKGVEK